MQDLLFAWITFSVFSMALSMMMVGFSISDARSAGKARGREKEFAREALIAILLAIIGSLLWPICMLGLVIWGVYLGLKSLIRLIKDAVRG